VYASLSPLSLASPSHLSNLNVTVALTWFCGRCRYKDLRLQLLEADQYPYLFKTLFGLLMLLPQSTAFETLKNRLATVTSLGVMHVMPKTKEKIPDVKDIDFKALLDHFSSLQKKHSESIRESTCCDPIPPTQTSNHK